jgi:hypothetical protein
LPQVVDPVLDDGPCPVLVLDLLVRRRGCCRRRLLEVLVVRPVVPASPGVRNGDKETRGFFLYSLCLRRHLCGMCDLGCGGSARYRLDRCCLVVGGFGGGGEVRFIGPPNFWIFQCGAKIGGKGGSWVDRNTVL